MKKKFFLVLVVLFALLSVSIATQAASMDDLTFDSSSGTITKCNKDAEGELVIPDKINGVNVIGIGDEAFDRCKRLRKIKLPGTINNIGSYAFTGCESLASAVIPDSVTSIGWGAFSYCTNLETADIPEQLTEISGCMFLECNKLQEITIPNSVEEIGSGAFAYCYEWSDIEIPDSVIRVGEGILDGTPYFDDETNWEDGILYYNDIILATEYGYTFDSNYRIKDGVRIISGAFFSQPELKTVTFPASVESICCSAFMYDKLDNIIFEGDVVPLIPMKNLAGITRLPFNTYYDHLGNSQFDVYYPADNPSYTAEAMEMFGYYDAEYDGIGRGRWITPTFYPYESSENYIDTANSAVDITGLNHVGNSIFGITTIDVSQIDSPIDTNETMALIAFYDGEGRLVSTSVKEYVDENDIYKLNIAPNDAESEIAAGKVFLWNRDTLAPEIEPVSVLRIE